MKIWQIVLYITVLLNSKLIHCKNETTFGLPDESVREDEKEDGDAVVWKKFQDKAQEFVNNLIRQSLPIMITINSDAKITRECSTAFYQLTFGLQNMKSWAMRMLDASGRPPAGLLDGSLVDYGDFDECLNVIVKDERSQNEEKFRGHYCRIDVRPLLPKKVPRLTHRTQVWNFENFTNKDSVLRDLGKNGPMFYLLWFQYGICVPSVCTKHDIQEVMEIALRGSPFEPRVLSCQKKEPVTISTTQLIVIGVFSTVGLVLFISTSFDFLQRRKRKFNEKEFPESSKIRNCLISFSLWSNLEKLMCTKATSDNMGVINGMRCLTMSWIILVHTYGFVNRHTVARLQEMKNSLEDVSFQIIINSWLSVDTFFLIGGIVVTHSTLKMMDKTNGSLNYIRYAIRRYWRLLPPIGAALGFVFLLPLFGSGPAWPEEVGGLVKRCKEKWWATLFGFNTWISKEEMCMFHTWYVSADIHYYLTAPLFLIPLYRWRTMGFLLLLAFTLASALTVGILTGLNDFYPTILYLLPDEEFTYKMINTIYAKPYSHVGSYCAGIFFGYLISRHQDHNMRPVYQLFGWIAAISCNLAIFFATYQWNRSYLPDTSIAVVYAALHRTGWALTIGWLIFICATGHGGILNKFLSWKAFLPLSRICYCAYIIHFLLLDVRNGFKRQKLFFSHYDFVYEFFGHLMTSILLAGLTYLVFEAPFAALDPIVFPKPKNNNYPKTIEQIPKDRRISNGKSSNHQNGINGHFTPTPDSTCL